jgi:hypothetical protein
LVDLKPAAARPANHWLIWSPPPDPQPPAALKPAAARPANHWLIRSPPPARDRWLI